VAALALVAKVMAAAGGEREFGLTFLACQAEEAGLLGSRFFVAGAESEKIVANINFESTPVWERSLDAFAEGARFSTLDETVREVAAGLGLGYSRFSLGDQGLFYRSDQFPFAQAGIPAIWLSAGERSASGRNRMAEFFKGGVYHTVKDEFDPGWELEALRQTVKLAVGLIERLNAIRQAPRWKGAPPFPMAAGTRPPSVDASDALPPNL
jgi:Zn-dependent M28 family amino/carboxypeptidase